MIDVTIAAGFVTRELERKKSMGPIQLVVFDLARTTIDDSGGAVLCCLVEEVHAYDLSGSDEELEVLPLRTHHLRRSQHRCDRFDVAGAAANIAPQSGAHVGLIGMWMLLQKGVGAHDEAGGTVSALRGSLLCKCFLNGMQ